MQDPNNHFSFKRFLDDNTNLLTVFAIFNALTLFSISINEDVVVRNLLTVSFWVLSLLAFFELSTTTLSTYNRVKFEVTVADRLKLSIFLCAVAFAQLSLLLYFGTLFPMFVAALIAGGIALAVLLGFIWLNLLITRIINRQKELCTWSDRKTMWLHKLNNWGMLALLFTTALLLILLTDKS